MSVSVPGVGGRFWSSGIIDSQRVRQGPVHPRFFFDFFVGWCRHKTEMGPTATFTTRLGWREGGEGSGRRGGGGEERRGEERRSEKRQLDEWEDGEDGEEGGGRGKKGTGVITAAGSRGGGGWQQDEGQRSRLGDWHGIIGNTGFDAQTAPVDCRQQPRRAAAASRRRLDRLGLPPVGGLAGLAGSTGRLSRLRWRCNG